MKEKFLLIDGSSLIFRAFFAIRNLTTKDGIHTNGVYGFLNMYKNAVDLVEPDYVVVAFDKAGPTFRNEDYEAYKANREKTPSELSAQFGILKDVLDAMNVKHIDMQAYEADDILGTISKMANEKGIETYLLTGDRDYFQLVNANATVLYTKKGISELEKYDMEKIYEKYQVSPLDLIEVKGLMGDKSDNIPGVPGIGEKTAIKLVKEYKTIDQVYENLDQVRGKKLKENLENYKMDAFLSRKLGTIYTDVPIDYEIDDFKLVEPDGDKLFEKFKMLEFSSLMKKFQPDTETVATNYQSQIVEKKDYKTIYEKVKKEKSLYLACLSSNDNYIHSDMAYLALKIKKEDMVYIFDLREDQEDFIREVGGLFKEDIEFIGFDLKKDIVLLNRLGLDFKAKYIDLMIAEYLIDPSKGTYLVADLSSKYLDGPVKNEEDYLGKGKNKKTFINLEEDQLREYLENYLNILEKSQDLLLDEIKEMDMMDLYYSIELPLVEVLASMEIAGISIEEERLEEIDGYLVEKIGELEKNIHSLAGYDFNINSPKQLGEVLFDKLQLPVIKKTKTGYSTNAEVLDKLQGQHEIIDYILDYRSLSKLKSTYVDGLYPHIDKDKKIRTTFRQNVTATGRISSTEPNLQNIPIRTEEGRQIRKAFVASENSILIAADYSQIELRVLASLSEDANMIEAFNQGLDIHTKTASEVFHVDLEKVTKGQRSDAKAVNFGIVYGISDYGLSRDLNIPRKTAKEYIDKYLASYPSIKGYMDQIVVDAKDKGYVETIFNRRRYIPELHSKNFNIRNFGERIALNTPIQGSAADIIKVAMVKVHKRLKAEGLKSKLILQIHDELIIDTLLEEEEIVERILKEEMEAAVRLKVDLIVDIDKGKSWYEA